MLRLKPARPYVAAGFSCPIKRLALDRAGPPRGAAYAVALGAINRQAGSLLKA